MSVRRWMTMASLGLAGLGATACETMLTNEPGALVPRTVAEDAGLPAITLNGTRLHLETLGNPANPVIVFLHGGPGGDYRSLLRLADTVGGYSLADEYYLVYYDQRGTGLSERVGKSTLTLNQYLADLDSIVDRYASGRPVILIGESWGGMLATDYINTHGAKVAGAVLIEPGPLTAAAFERLKSQLFGLDLGAEWLNDFAWDTEFLTPDDHARRDYQLAIGARDGQPAYHQREDVDPSPFWRLGAAANEYIREDGTDAHGHANYDFTSHLDAFASPVLFVAGSLSEVLGPSLQQDQVQLYPSATLQVVTGAGHDVAWVKTPEVLVHIRTYLDALKGAAQ